MRSVGGGACLRERFYTFSEIILTNPTASVGITLNKYPPKPFALLKLPPKKIFPPKVFSQNFNKPKNL